jgi:RNA polymerase sigma-70 factor (ECF subfamily)
MRGDPSGPGSPDPGSIRDLYERLGPDLLRLAYRLTGSREDAEDVVQDVFVGLPDALRRYREEGKLDAWIRRIAARVALTRMRHRSRRREVELEATHATTAGHSDTAAGQITLQRALDRLPESLRAVVVLKELEGYSHEEIAEMLHIRVGASKVRLHRAKERLRQLLRSPR